MSRRQQLRHWDPRAYDPWKHNSLAERRRAFRRDVRETNRIVRALIKAARNRKAALAASPKGTNHG